jgi:hypothetical protein
MLCARDKQSNALARYSLLPQRIGTLPRPSVPSVNSTGLPGQGVPRFAVKMWQSCNARKQTVQHRIGDVPSKLLVRPRPDTRNAPWQYPSWCQRCGNTQPQPPPPRICECRRYFGPRCCGINSALPREQNPADRWLGRGFRRDQCSQHAKYTEQHSIVFLLWAGLGCPIDPDAPATPYIRVRHLRR